MPEASTRPGIQRAAILLMSVGEKAAGEILKHVDAGELQRLTHAMTEISGISRGEAASLLDQFARAAHEVGPVTSCSPAYVRAALVSAFGDEQANAVLERFSAGRANKGLEQLKWAEPRVIVDLIRGEHPQTIAILLAYLDPQQGSRVLALLPEALRPDIMVRLATLDEVHPSALAALDVVIEKQLKGGGGVNNFGGPKFAASLLTQMDRGLEESLLAELRQTDSELAERIETLMFTFDDLAGVEDRGLQALLREVSGPTLATALRGADQRMRDKVFANMSKRAAEILNDDMEAKGPVRLSEVDAAQKEILTIARRLQGEGTLSLGQGGRDQFV
jgi:flagellar motor switch protein FliG